MPLKEQQQITEMFNDISKTYDKVNTILSFGLHTRWKKRLIQEIPHNNSVKLLDLATGTGDILIDALLQSKIESGVGIDLAEKMLKIGAQKANLNHLSNRLSFQVANALSLPFEAHSFDCTCISFGIRNVQNPLLALKEMYRVLKQEGKALILEFSIPQNAILKRAHLFYLRHLLPKIGGLLSKSTSSYVYLNKTIETFPYGESFLRLMKEAGFNQVKAVPLAGGIVTLYVGEKKEEALH